MIVTKDKVVTISYTLINFEKRLLDDRTVAEPVSYLHGHGKLFPELERALEGRQPGDSVRVEIPAVRGYGERNEALVVRFPMENIEGINHVEEGMRLEASTRLGSQMVTVRQVDTDGIVVDGNHPLAGIDLIFFVTIKDVREAAGEELAHGHVHGDGQVQEVHQHSGKNHDSREGPAGGGANRPGGIAPAPGGLPRNRG